MTDIEIIQCMREGKYNPAMKGLYAYLPVVKKFVQKNNGTKQEAEDVFQEGLMIFCKKLANVNFELRCSINTYLYSVCKLLWLDELKKKNKQIKNDFLPLEDKYLSEEINIDIENDKPIKTAQEAVLMLGEKCKELLQLFYFKNMSMAQIAIQLGFKTEKVAKNQKYRCIEKAKENLKQLTH
jgi:RNA polymerase sigma factor (sigma-70 family)